jgi:hypothetical protein
LLVSCACPDSGPCLSVVHGIHQQHDLTERLVQLSGRSVELRENPGLFGYRFNIEGPISNVSGANAALLLI